MGNILQRIPVGDGRVRETEGEVVRGVFVGACLVDVFHRGEMAKDLA
jgi:hypothetical protein